MENTKTVKQTAANNKFLANVKRCMNALVYAECLRLVNRQGIDSGVVYVGKFFRENNRESILSEFRKGTYNPLTTLL